MSDSVYGIDLGTTYSAIARINDLGQADVLANIDLSPTTASVVYFEAADSAVVGAEAKRTQRMDPENACSLIKRHMGTVYPQEFRGKEQTPETISALILKELVKIANSELGEEVSQVVITVPAYFGIKEKEATKQAGRIAGLEVVGIVTEPVAAALHHRARSGQRETILVYDLGGGTFDTTVLRAETGKIEVVAIDGNKTLGGADWDQELAQIIVEKFVAQADIADEDPMLDSEFAADLLNSVEDAKKSLTQRDATNVHCSYLAHREQVSVTRDEFEAGTRHLLSQTVEITERVLAAAQQKISGLTIDRVLLVGGSSKMPMVDAALRERFGWVPESAGFDLAVAKGAAIYGQATVDEILRTDGDDIEAPPNAEPKYFLGGSKTLSVTNVLSRGLGVRFVRPESSEEFISFVDHANDPLPAAPVTITAATTVDNQTSVAIALYEQGGELESENPADNDLLDERLLSVPSLPKGSPIEVTLEVTAEGLARVTAFDPTGGKAIDVEAQVSALSQEQVEGATQQVSGIALRS